MATGGSDVWGINSNSHVFHYSFAQENFVQAPGILTQIEVGVNDVWGIDSSSGLYRYDPNNGGWNLIGFADQVAAGGDGEWVIAGTNNIWRFDSSAETFVEVSGDLKSIAVGSGAGLFGVSPSNQVFAFVRP